MLNEKLKSEGKDLDKSVITKKAIKEFYEAIIDSPELYPEFMELRQDGLWRMCNMMASYLTRLLSKDRITPADTQYLKKVHQSMNISETSYDKFTGLFAHICCRNKSDTQRKKMLSMFLLLKAHICPIASGGKNLAAFCGVLKNLPFVPQKEEIDKKKSTKWLDSFPEPIDSYFLRSSRYIGRGQIWDEQAQFFHLRKRLRKLEKVITVIHNKSKRMEIRVSRLEVESRKKQTETKQHRDLELVYS